MARRRRKDTPLFLMALSGATILALTPDGRAMLDRARRGLRR